MPAARAREMPTGSRRSDHHSPGKIKFCPSQPVSSDSLVLRFYGQNPRRSRQRPFCWVKSNWKVVAGNSATEEIETMKIKSVSEETPSSI